MNEELRMKNILYKIFIFVLLLISMPVMAVAALLIAVTSGFPILYSQKRAGKNGKPFTMYKFRTMIVGADRQKSKYKNLNIAKGPAFKIKDDPRFTKIGKFLSHTGLDELPQLFNVLSGDMALIGPRPLPIDEAGALYGWQKARETMTPGIISPWILNGYHTNTFDEWMRSDIAYIEKKSLWFDFRLTLRTVKFLTKLITRELSGKA